MKRASIQVFAVMMVAAALPAIGQDEAAALNARGERQLEQFVTEVRSLTGRFVQTVFDAEGAVEDEYSGTLDIDRPGRFRWVYEWPFEQRLIADGTNLWNYDVDLDQVSVTAQDEALGQSPAAVLSGTGEVLETLEIQGAFERDGVLWVQMAVTEDSSDFSALRFGFDSESGQIAGMQITDTLGQLTVIRFDNVRTNVEMQESLFEFEPPEGIDVIGVPAGDDTSAGEVDFSDALPVAGFG
ncbi:MAG: outer membrane lipoprotein chaperone LolA [Pseudomonadota bacterium]